jgi:hypothetical protein
MMRGQVLSFFPAILFFFGMLLRFTDSQQAGEQPALLRFLTMTKACETEGSLLTTLDKKLSSSKKGALFVSVLNLGRVRSGFAPGSGRNNDQASKSKRTAEKKPLDSPNVERRELCVA